MSGKVIKEDVAIVQEMMIDEFANLKGVNVVVEQGFVDESHPAKYLNIVDDKGNVIARYKRVDESKRPSAVTYSSAFA